MVQERKCIEHHGEECEELAIAEFGLKYPAGGFIQAVEGGQTVLDFLLVACADGSVITMILLSIAGFAYSLVSS